MRSGATDVSQSVFDLHMTIFWICVVIGVLVFGVMIYSMIAHRRSKRQHSANFHENTRVEVLWTVIPLLILVGMAIPATRTLIHIYDSSESDVDVQITGYQWKWHYKYLGEDVEFFSNLTTPRDQINNQSPKGEHYLLEVDEPLVIPAGAKVRFLITAADVIHSWWVPDLAVKKDAIPGFINESWTRVEQPGIYRGQCTELCGKDHGFMPVVVRALPAEEYDAWYAEQLGVAAVAEETIEAEAEQQWSDEVLLAKGEEIYSDHCVACHQANGAGVPPVFPAIAGSAVATGPVDTHLDVVYNGRPGTAMQAFGQQLSATEIAAVMHYQRNAFGNDTGDVVQPQDVLAYSQGR